MLIKILEYKSIYVYFSSRNKFKSNNYINISFNILYLEINIKAISRSRLYKHLYITYNRQV